MSGRYLAEVSERDASAPIREIYAEIRDAFGVVNLLYRHLAATPGRLERVWGDVGPLLREPETTALAAELIRSVGVPAVDSLPADAVSAAGIGAAELDGVRATLRVYARANALNLLASQALLHGADVPREAGEPPGGLPTVSGEVLPPLADPAQLDEPLRRVLEQLSGALVGGRQPILVPSLLRHLAHYPPVLELSWAALRPALADAGMPALAAEVEQEARLLAGRLPRRVERAADPGIRAVLTDFAGPMARMLVAGAAFGRLFDLRLT